MLAMAERDKPEVDFGNIAFLNILTFAECATIVRVVTACKNSVVNE